VSEHADAHAAAAAARRHAEATGGGDVIVHDRYHHLHRTHREGPRARGAQRGRR
jgi:hypothetical protein